MIIRTARPEERQSLEDLQRRASLAGETYRRQLEEHPDAILLPPEQVDRGDVLVAETTEGILGFAALIGGELDGLFVEPQHQRRGIGRALVESAVHEARRRGLSLVTVVASPEARAFYERCGFRAEDDSVTRFGPAFKMSR